MKVTVSDLSPVVQHAEELWEAGTSPTHDFDARANGRSKEKFIEDRIRGKVGEMAFAQFLEETLDVSAEVDFDIYESEQVTDYADLKSIDGKKPACQFDIKTTKMGNLWLAVREQIWDDHSPTDPFIVCLVEADECTPGGSPTVDIRGWVEVQDVDERIARGERLYHPSGGYEIGPPMKGDNMCTPISDIPDRSVKEWDDFVDERLVR